MSTITSGPSELLFFVNGFVVLYKFNKKKNLLLGYTIMRWGIFVIDVSRNDFEDWQGYQIEERLQDM